MNVINALRLLLCEITFRLLIPIAPRNEDGLLLLSYLVGYFEQLNVDAGLLKEADRRFKSLR